jgi:uncharacterized RDD family membrane protein YckC
MTIRLENKDLNTTEEPIAQLVPASYAKRMANYVIDYFLFGFIAFFVLIQIAPLYPLLDKIKKQQPIGLEESLLLQFFYGLFMSVTESVLKGKSVGKYITGTRAVEETGLPLASKTAFVRGLIRIIPFPFDQVSAFMFAFDPFRLLPPYPWHDRWSKSIVVDEAKSLLPKK